MAPALGGQSHLQLLLSAFEAGTLPVPSVPQPRGLSVPWGGSRYTDFPFRHGERRTDMLSHPSIRRPFISFACDASPGSEPPEHQPLAGPTPLLPGNPGAWVGTQSAAAGAAAAGAAAAGPAPRRSRSCRSRHWRSLAEPPLASPPERWSRLSGRPRNRGGVNDSLDAAVAQPTKEKPIG